MGRSLVDSRFQIHPEGMLYRANLELGLRAALLIELDQLNRYELIGTARSAAKMRELFETFLWTYSILHRVS